MLLPDRIRAEIYKQLGTECRAYRTVAAQEQKLLSGVALSISLFFELLGCRDDTPHRIACLLFLIGAARKIVGDDYRKIVRAMQVPHKMINSKQYSTANLGMRVLAEYGEPLSVVCSAHKAAYTRGLKAYPEHALKYEAVAAIARDAGIEVRGSIHDFMSGNGIDKKEWLDDNISSGVRFGLVVGKVRKALLLEHADILRRQRYISSKIGRSIAFDITMTAIVDKLIERGY